MNLIVIDDEPITFDLMTKNLKDAEPDCNVECFSDVEKALLFIQNNFVDVAFLDIEMAPVNGIRLAAEIKQIKPEVSIIFVTGYSEYALEAFALHVSGYLLKPPSVDKIKMELNHIKAASGIPIKPKNEHSVRVQTFGNFEVFYNNNKIKFERSKTKELLAYLVDRKGAACTSADIAAVLWEDRENSVKTLSLLRHLISDLTRTFKELNSEDVIIRSRNSIAIALDKIDCDYYDFLRGRADIINSYFGEYMSNYSWAEFTSGHLSSMKKNT